MIVAFCEPLIDAIINVEDSLMKEWGIRDGDAIINNSHYQPLVDYALSHKDCSILCGGAGQNTLSMAQWMMDQPNKTMVFGAVGSDNNKKVLETMIKNNGVTPNYMEINGKTTGCCVVFISNSNRSFVASLSASSSYDFSKWDSPATISAIKNSKVVFTSCFFLRHSDKIAFAAAAEAMANNADFALSLSAPNIIESNTWHSIRGIIRSCTLLFGNKDEYFSLAKQLGYVKQGDDIDSVNMKEIAKLISEYGNPTRSRIVVITMASEPAIACKTSDVPVTCDTIPISKDKIIDTNGAGDSFAGGFLSQYVKGESIKKCLKAGCYAAWCNIQQKGCTIPSFKPNFQ